MPYDIAWNEDGTVLHLSGVTTIHHINEANGKLYADPRFDNHKYQIWDLSDADFTDISKEDIEEAAGTDKGAAFSIPRMKVAFIAKDTHTINITRYYIALSKKLNSTWTFLLCDTFEEAMKWAKS